MGNSVITDRQCMADSAEMERIAVFAVFDVASPIRSTVFVSWREDVDFS